MVNVAGENYWSGVIMLNVVLSCFLLLLVPVVGVGQNSPGPGIFALRTMLQDKDPEIRTKAAEGLGRVGGRESVLILRQGKLQIGWGWPC